MEIPRRMMTEKELGEGPSPVEAALENWRSNFDLSEDMTEVAKVFLHVARDTGLEDILLVNLGG